MTRYEFEAVQVPLKKLCGAPRAILMVDTVESVASDTGTEPFVGAGICRRSRRNFAMETRVEDGHLRDIAEPLFHRLDSFQLGTIVERSECRDACNSGLHGRSNPNGFFVLLAAVNYPMPNYTDVGR